MATSLLPADFKEFLKLLNSQQVEYLLIGGYAVGYYGYPRATADIDIWIATNPPNARKVADVIREFFGSDVQGATPELFLPVEGMLAQAFGDVWGVDAQRLRSVSGFSRCRRRDRRVQRKIHVRPIRTARWFLRHVAKSYSPHLSKFLSTGKTLAVHRNQTRTRPRMNW